MLQTVFNRVVESVNGQYSAIKGNKSLKFPNIHPPHREVANIGRLLAYGIAADALKEYLNNLEDASLNSSKCSVHAL